MSLDKIAIIGSGASAFGVISQLNEKNFKGKIEIIDNHDISEIFYSQNSQVPEYKKKSKKDVLEIHKKNGFKFPPPKCYYGLLPKKININNSKIKLNDSCNFGGLTSFWGGSLLPFNETELKNWKIKRFHLDEYYKKVSKYIPISGEYNNLNIYYGDCYENNDPINPIINHSLIEKNLLSNNDELKYFVGRPKLALKYSNSFHNCNYPGICEKNCNNHNIFKTNNFFENFIKSNENVSYINDKVLSINTRNNSIRGKRNLYSNFHKIYICAGAINTSKIILNSFQEIKSLKFFDNTIIQTPFLDLNKNNETRSNFDLTQMQIVSQKNNSEGTMYQVYYSSPYLIDFYLPYKLKKIFKNLIDNYSKKIIWLRGYSKSTNNNNYIISKKNNKFFIDIEKRTNKKLMDLELKSLKKILKKNKFYSLNKLNFFSQTSSHYGCSIPYGDKNFNLNTNGEIAKNIFITDSSVFNSLPSTSPTFTIIANAARTVNESL